jgi:DNA ligase (NAD+)
MSTLQIQSLEEQDAIAAQHGLVRDLWHMPKTCPCCGTQVKRDEGTVAYYCPNEACRVQVIERLKHALGKSSLDWDGMGEETVTAIVEASLFVGVPQITQLSHIIALPGDIIAEVLKPAALKKFLTERERVKKAPLWRKIHALGIEGIGRSTAQDLAIKWTSAVIMLTNDPHQDVQAAIDEVKSVLGDVVLERFVNFMCKNAHEIEALEGYGYLFEEAAERIGVLTGNVFCITGTMMSGTREWVGQLVESKGGTVKSSVSKKVDYLVSGPGGGANKAAAAQKHGTQIITEEQLYELMGEKMRTPVVTREESES